MNLNIQNSNNGKITVNLDKYSRVVLTAIAICLMLIVINIYFGPRDVKAYDSIQDVNVKSIGGSSVSGGYMPVDIQRIDGSTSKTLPVDIKSLNGRNIFGDKLPIDIQGINGQFIIGSDLPVKIR